MSKLKIFTFPDKVLAETAIPVSRVEKEHRRLADDMLETMYDAPGIGLAANQVGILQRFLVIDTEYELEEEAGEEGFREGTEVAGNILHKKPIVIINPEIIYREGEICFTEGCLSVPEYSAEVKRAEKIKLKYQDIDGAEKILSADGLMAVCIQHEIDHLDGKLFIDRISPLKRDLAKKKLIKNRKQKEGE